VARRVHTCYVFLACLSEWHESFLSETWKWRGLSVSYDSFTLWYSNTPLMDHLVISEFVSGPPSYLILRGHLKTWKNYKPVTSTQWLMIAFITWNSNLVPLLEGLCSSNPCRFEFSGFWGFCRKRILFGDSPSNLQVDVDTHTHTHKQTHVRAHTHLHIHWHTHTHVPCYTQTHACTLARTHIHTSTVCLKHGGGV